MFVTSAWQSCKLYACHCKHFASAFPSLCLPCQPVSLGSMSHLPLCLYACLAKLSVATLPHLPVCLHLGHIYLSACTSATSIPVCLHPCDIYLCACTSATSTYLLAPRPHLPVCLHPCHIYLSACTPATSTCLLAPLPHLTVCLLFAPLPDLPIYLFLSHTCPSIFTFSSACLYVPLVTPIWFLATLSVRVLLHHTNLSGWTCHFGLSVPWLSIPMSDAPACLSVSDCPVCLLLTSLCKFKPLRCVDNLPGSICLCCTMFRIRYQTQHFRNCTPYKLNSRTNQ